MSKILKLYQEENYSDLTNVTRARVIENAKGKEKSKNTKAKKTSNNFVEAQEAIRDGNV